MHENWIFHFLFTSHGSTIYISTFSIQKQKPERNLIILQFLLSSFYLGKNNSAKKNSRICFYFQNCIFHRTFFTDACSDKSFLSTYIPLTTKHCKSLCKILRMSVLCWILYAHIIILFCIPFPNVCIQQIGHSWNQWNITDPKIKAIISLIWKVSAHYNTLWNIWGLRSFCFTNCKKKWFSIFIYVLEFVSYTAKCWYNISQNE